MALCARWASIYMNVRTADNAIDESVNGLRKTISTMETGEQNVSTGFAESRYGQERADLSLISGAQGRRDRLWQPTILRKRAAPRKP